jgi:DNA-binding MarR family transcriptional regulator
MPAEHHPLSALTLDEQIITLVAQVAKRSSAHVDESVRQHQLTRAQALLLRSLDAPMRMHQIALRLDCEPSNVTGIVDRLEARGLIQRVEDPADRRAKCLTVTARGELVRAHLGAVAPSFPGLSALSEADKRRLHKLLVRVASATES